MTPQEAAERLAEMLTTWQRDSGYVMVCDGNSELIVATIDPHTGGWHYGGAYVVPGPNGWEVE